MKPVFLSPLTELFRLTAELDVMREKVSHIEVSRAEADAIMAEYRHSTLPAAKPASQFMVDGFLVKIAE